MNGRMNGAAEADWAYGAVARAAALTLLKANGARSATQLDSRANWRKRGTGSECPGRAAT